MPRKCLTWVDAVVLAVAKHGGTAHLNRMYDDAPRIYGYVPGSVDSVIRQAVESHSSDSEQWRRGTPDLFYSVEGLRSGIWGLREPHRTVGDLISELGVTYLGVFASMADPSLRGPSSDPLGKIKAMNVVGFAKDVLPRLQFWTASN